jgi:hypothetical protein
MVTHEQCHLTATQLVATAAEMVHADRLIQRAERFTAKMTRRGELVRMRQAMDISIRLKNQLNRLGEIREQLIAALGGKESKSPR